MYYGCVMQSGVVYSLNKVKTMSSKLRLTPKFQILPPRKGAPKCLFSAYEGAQTLHMHVLWMCDAEWGGLQPQQSQNNVVLAPPDPKVPKFAPRKGAPKCLFSAYEGAQTLHIHVLWMCDAEWGG
jgi:hypothetical protein